MKVVGTFDPKTLYHQQKTAERNTGFAAMLAFNLDKKPGEQDVTALFASNSSELERLYEQAAGKRPGEEGDRVFVFWNRVTVNNYWAGEFMDNSSSSLDEWLIPAGIIPSNRNMKYSIR